jgi:hypothetical protein
MLRRTGSLTACLLGALSGVGCSYLDNEDRSPKGGSLPGSVLETAMTDNELTESGAEVVYRFRSIPNLVYVRNFGPRSRAVSIDKSREYRSLLERFGKRQLIDSVPTRPNTFFSATEEHGSTYDEAGFADAARLLIQTGRSLRPVRIGIVDSGIVPATSRIQKALVGNVNLTSEGDQCQWQDHATAIASLFVGTVDESTNPAGPCVPHAVRAASLSNASYSYAPLFANPLAPNAELFGVKISFDSDSGDSLSKDLGSLQLAVALDAAVANGAQLVNMSFSYARVEPDSEVRHTERYVLANGAAKGVVFVAAAGNAGVNIDKKTVYPPRYALQNLLVVGSHSKALRRSEDSNYGTTVDVTAQGVSVPANSPDGSVKLFTGTSFSAPVVVAALAWYLGATPGANSYAMIQDLFATATPAYLRDASGTETVSRYGRLNVSEFIRRGLARQNGGR